MSEKIIKKRKREVRKVPKREFNILHLSKRQIQMFETFVEEHVFEPGYGTTSAH